MAIANVGGDAWVAYKQLVTAAANLADKTLVTAGGAVPASAAATPYGVVEKDTASGDLATVKVAPSIVEVLAMGTVTAGNMVEALQGSVYGNINGVSTAITACGVQNIASGYPVGKALTSSDANGTVLVSLLQNNAKTA